MIVTTTVSGNNKEFTIAGSTESNVVDIVHLTSNLDAYGRSYASNQLQCTGTNKTYKLYDDCELVFFNNADTVNNKTQFTAVELRP